MNRHSSRGHQRLLVSASLVLLLVLLLGACTTNVITPPQKPDPFVSHLDTYINAEVHREDFSGVVLIARAGKVLLSKGYSMADWEQHLPNTPHTKFHIASLTKAFTAMAILMLQEQGKLHVQDHLCSYLSQCPKAWQAITIFHLLTHTSGIPTLQRNPFPTLPSSAEQAVAEAMALYKDKPLDFPPGSQFSYSNAGYDFLGYLIQKVSGEPFVQFLQHQIFDPLHMSETGYAPDYAGLANHATGYAAWQVKVADAIPSLPPDLSFLIADRGLYSTVEDLYRWDQALYTHRLVSQLSLDEMFTPHISLAPYVTQCTGPNDELVQLGYGYGWCIGSESQAHRQIIFHTGSALGFKASFQRYPADRVTIIVLSNLDTVFFPRNPFFLPGLEALVFGEV
jgi:CubicO group peptidase (beta-lactamase class C family)